MKTKIDHPNANLATVSQADEIARQGTPPVPPFWGAIDIAPPIDAVMPLMSDATIMQSRWEFKKGSLTEAQHLAVLNEKAAPLLAEWKERIISEKLFQPIAKYGYFPVQADGDALNVYALDRSEIAASFVFPRQSKGQTKGRGLALSDYFCGPHGYDVLPIFMVTLGHPIQEKIAALYRDDRYGDYFYLHGLAAEFTEACAKWLYVRIKTELNISGGKRFSFGYPSCPDLAGNRTILELLDGQVLGVRLSETMQMEPEFTTCALVAWHPQAEYLAV
jgi:5-methyltetrahydrofolate--homocysteine methyltransferase